LPEDEIDATFSDCERGAIPAIGEAYGVDVVIDPSLVHQPDVYFESGDHEHLIRMTGDDFRGLMAQRTPGPRQPSPVGNEFRRSLIAPTPGLV
jgi:prolyl-tRNA editing enzyme YbaK/EbsC (Cys-tRNA(Pro) deacylase)